MEGAASFSLVRPKSLRGHKFQEYLILRLYTPGLMVQEYHFIQTDAILNYESPKVSSTNWRKCHQIYVPPTLTVDGPEIFYAALTRTQRKNIDEAESATAHRCHEALVSGGQGYPEVRLNIDDFLFGSPPPFKVFEPERVS